MGGSDRLTALDLTTSLAGAYASHLLVLAGVEVTRVEPPDGHPLARWRAGGPLPEGTTGALATWLAGGVERLVAHPDRPEDLDAVLRHAAAVDAVLWEPEAPVTLERLEAAAGHVTVTAVTPFGLTGPWAGRPATEFTLQALSGGPALRGARGWPPLPAGGRHGEYMAGVVAAVATLVGLRDRMVSDRRGGVIDVSAFEAVLMTQLFNPHTLETQVDGVRARRPKATVGDVVRTADGWVGFAVVNRLQHWWDFCAMVERPDWAEDRTLDPVPARAERADELNPVIAAWAAARTTAEIVELATLLRIPCVEVGNGETIPTLDGGALAHFFEENPDEGFLQPAAPFRIHPPVPGVGATRPASPHARPVAAPRAHRRRPAPAPGGAPAPFAGLRVAEFTAFWAGPFFAQTLAMFGADVVKVESCARPDGARLMNQHPVSTPQWWERSAYFHSVNTMKRGVTLDMNDDEGRALARRLVEHCDVVVENSSPRVMDGWGLGWEDLHALRPDLIMVRMPAFGLSGPWRDRTGFAMTMEQVSGMSWVSGFPEHSPVGLFGPCDPSAGLHALVAFLAALEHRRRTGEGRLVEVPMVGGALHVAAEQVIEHSAYGVRLDRAGCRGTAAAPQGCYPAADHDPVQDTQRWVAIAVADDRQWAGLRRAMGQPGWADHPALASAAGRREHHDLLDRELAAWCAGLPATAVVDRLVACGVPAAPVLHPTEHLGMDQLAHRRFFEELDHPVHGRSVLSTFPFRLPGHHGAVHRRHAPLLGEHDDAVLGGLLGLTPDHLAALRARGVIGHEVR